METEDSVRESVAEQDTEALLLRDVLLNGILAIGTLGHNVNSLCAEACHEQHEFISMDREKVEQEKYEEEKSGDEDDTSAMPPSEPEPAVEPAQMRSSSTNEYNFTCSVKEEILMCEVEVEDVAKIQEQPLLMVEKVEKVRTTLADLFAAETFSSSDTGEKSYQKSVIIAGASASRATLCMDKMHQKKPTKPMPDPLKATRKLSRVWLSSSLSYTCCKYPHFMEALTSVSLLPRPTFFPFYPNCQHYCTPICIASSSTDISQYSNESATRKFKLTVLHCLLLSYKWFKFTTLLHGQCFICCLFLLPESILIIDNH
jgi:hypothetical protein